MSTHDYDVNVASMAATIAAQLLQQGEAPGRAANLAVDLAREIVIAVQARAEDDAAKAKIKPEKPEKAEPEPKHGKH